MAFPAGGVNPTPCEARAGNPVQNMPDQELGRLIEGVERALTVWGLSC